MSQLLALTGKCVLSIFKSVTNDSVFRKYLLYENTLPCSD